MPERIIRTLHATLSDGTEVVQGQKVDLSAEDEARLEEQKGLVPDGFESFAEFHDYMQDAYRSGRGDITAAGRLAEARAGGIEDIDAPVATTGDSVEAYSAWLTANSPNIDEVLARVGDDPAKAEAMLAAEREVTGNKPRQGVEDGLSKIVGGE